MVHKNSKTGFVPNMANGKKNKNRKFIRSAKTNRNRKVHILRLPQNLNEKNWAEIKDCCFHKELNVYIAGCDDIGQTEI